MVGNLEHDLRATEEDIAADSARLTSIEREKDGPAPDDPRLAELSAEGERLARRMMPKTVAEPEKTEELSGPSAPRADPASHLEAGRGPGAPTRAIRPAARRTVLVLSIR